MKSLHVLLTTTLMLFFAWQGMRGQEPRSCGCQGGSDVTTTITLCIAGTNYSATITRCEKWANNLTDPCGTNYRPDVVSFFKSICLDSTINFNVDSVLAAVLCYYDPCRGNGLGATVPNCDANPDHVFCWAYGFPKCWTRTSDGCYQSCGEDLCCWRHRRYCVNPVNGTCQLKPGAEPNDWSCSSEGNCNESCIMPTLCAPAPKCSTCP